MYMYIIKITIFDVFNPTKPEFWTSSEGHLLIDWGVFVATKFVSTIILVTFLPCLKDHL